MRESQVKSSATNDEKDCVEGFLVLLVWATSNDDTTLPWKSFQDLGDVACHLCMIKKVSAKNSVCYPWTIFANGLGSKAV